MDCQEFKKDFLLKCAEAGLDEQQTLELAKSAIAAIKQSNLLGTAKDLVLGASDKVMSYGVPAYALSALGVGAAGGYGLAKLRGINDDDADTVHTQEKIDAYRRARKLIETRRHLRQKQQDSRPSRRPSLI